LVLESPFLVHLAAGRLKTAHYARVLVEIFHYTRHTPRLLAAACARLRPADQRLFDHFMNNAHEEAGHDRWALADLAALGYDVEAVVKSDPLPATAAMVAYSYWVIDHVDPRGLLGSNYALETLGAGPAGDLAGLLQRQLGIPDAALTFLRGHADSDPGHISALSDVLNTIDDPEVEALVLRTARVVYSLYRSMLDQAFDEASAGRGP
jgi:pyrroloquinoline quinone (PQQ) biosynthesis protein C